MSFIVYFDRIKDFLTSEKWEGWKVGNLRPVFEPILWFMKPYKIGGTLADNVLEYEVGAYNEKILDKYNQKTNNLFFIKSQHSDKGLHPTQKPLKLMELLIELTTTKEQIVLDPFAGSATTLVAAYNLDRHFIGFEKSKEYYSIAKQRIDDLQNSPLQQSLCL